MDNRVVIWEHRGYKGINGIGNNIVKFKKKITINNNIRIKKEIMRH